MTMNKGYVVVTLRATMFGQESVAADTITAVSRETRNNLVAGKIARDATDEEIAEYRASEEDADALLGDVDALAEQKRALEVELQQLQGRKTELAGDLQALESDVADLGKQKETLAGEVKALEAAKAAAEKPATKAAAK